MADTVVPNTEVADVDRLGVGEVVVRWWRGRAADVDGDRGGAVHAGVVGYVVVEGVSAMKPGIRRVEEAAGAVGVLERAVRGEGLGHRKRDRVPVRDRCRCPPR